VTATPTTPAGAAVPARPERAARVLHTSDWHLGSAVRGHPRAADHAAVIAELLTIAASVRPDLIVHTGDLFDGHRPPMPEFGRAIRALRDLAEIAPVVVLAGNHDSATAMEVLATAVGDDCADEVAAGRYDPWSRCRHRIRVLARPTTAERGAVATYPSAAGAEIRLAGLPFVHANRVLTDFAELNQANATYADKLRIIIGLLTKAVRRGFDPARHVAVFASHLHLTGATTSSERAIHVSTDYATDPVNFGGDYAYVACGHIHVPQVLGGVRGRYAGSILEVDFGEEGEAKSVVVVDAEPGRPARQTLVPLTAGRRLRRLKASLSTLAGEADRIGTAIVEVTVVSEPGGSPADADDAIVVGGVAFDSLARAVTALLPDATVVSVIDGRRDRVVTADELETSTQPVGSVNELYRSWLVANGRTHLAKHAAADPARLVELFDELHHAVVNGETPEPAEAAKLARLGMA
jgi:exonuclease SbcD